ncbi:MAG: hypothetical protein AAGA48_36040 [Myxococcota bacterium]
MNELLPLLRRIRDGHADADDVHKARALVANDARLDPELREIALTDAEDLAGDAAGLLAVLGADDLGPLLAEAIAFEGGRAPPAESIEADELDAQTWTYGPQVAEAVAHEAGPVDVVEPVLEGCALAESWSSAQVAHAVRFEAGAIDVVAPVLAACGLQEPALPVAEAVRDEAGSMAIADAVVRWSDIDLGAAVRAAAGPVNVVAAVMQEVGNPLPNAVVQPAEPSLVPANDTRAFAAVGLLLAAAVALFVSLAGIDTAPTELPPMVFAHADEVVVEDLTSDGNVFMLQGDGQDGAVILWIDEES